MVLGMKLFECGIHVAFVFTNNCFYLSHKNATTVEANIHQKKLCAYCSGNL